MGFKLAKKKAKDSKAKVDFLTNVPEEKRFWLCDGGVLSNLVQLRDALQNMNDGVYTYHANAERNDFANWVGDVVSEKSLAKQLQASKDQKEAYQKVAETVRRYGKQ